MDTRYAAEAEFHNRAFATDVRQPAKKYYKVIGIASTFYRNFLENHCAGKKVLEYGCGDNSFATYLAKRGAKVSAIDISDFAIADCKARALRQGIDSIDYRVMNAEQLEYPDRSFDVICGTAILHHLVVDVALREIARTLKPNGVAIFREPLAYNPLFNLYRRLTPKLRTKDEHPLVMAELALLNKYFDRVEMTHYHLFSLLSVPFMKLRMGQPILRALDAFDAWVFRNIKIMRRYAWTVVIVVGNPKQHA